MLEKIALEVSKILIIDQNEDGIKSLQKIFIAEKYAIATLTKIDDNIFTIITNTKPDLILLDLQLNGLELCKNLQKNNNGKSFPIMLMAEQVDPYKIAEGFNSGAIDYINKPFQIEEGRSRVRTNIKNSRLNTALTVLN